MVFVYRVAARLRGLERRHSGSRDGDGLPGPRIAALARGAAADGELTKPRDRHDCVARKRVGNRGEHGADQVIGSRLGRGHLVDDVGGQLVRVHCVLLTS